MNRSLGRTVAAILVGLVAVVTVATQAQASKGAATGTTLAAPHMSSPTVCRLGKQPSLRAAERAHPISCTTPPTAGPFAPTYGPGNKCLVRASRMYRRGYYANGVSYQRCKTALIREAGLFTMIEEFWQTPGQRGWHLMNTSRVQKDGPRSLLGHLTAIAASKCQGKALRLWDNKARGFFEDHVGDWYATSNDLLGYIPCL